jgi:hypothetical protein
MHRKPEVDDSFKEHIGDLKSFHDEIAYVMNGLSKDVYFDPGEDYITERASKGDYVVCQHVRGWCGYKLGWYYKYVNGMESTVSHVVIFLLPPNSEDLPYLSLKPEQHL